MLTQTRDAVCETEGEGIKEKEGQCCQLGLFVLNKSTAKGQINRAHGDPTPPKPQHLQSEILSRN